MMLKSDTGLLATQLSATDTGTKKQRGGATMIDSGTLFTGDRGGFGGLNTQ